jgi:RNA polymerase sigma-70 factor, ECF subfamily
MAETDISHIVQRFKNGERAAFTELVRIYQDRIYNLCAYMLNDIDEARDASQDTFIKAYKNLDRFKPKASFYTWLYRVAVNTCLDYRKRSYPEPLQQGSTIEDVPSSAASPEELYQSKEIASALQSALQRIPEKYRAAIVLKEIEGLSYEEIADTLQVSIGTVKSRIWRARYELRRLIKS